MGRYKNRFLKTLTFFSPIAIALAALLLSTWQAYEYRKHFRLSVRPVIQLISELASGEHVNGTLITNAGFGPAIIQEFRIYVDGKPISNDDNSCGWENALRLLNLTKKPIEFFCLAKGGFIKSGETYPLLTIKKKNLTRESYLALKNAMARIDYCIKYASLYEESFGGSCGDTAQPRRPGD